MSADTELSPPIMSAGTIVSPGTSSARRSGPGESAMLRIGGPVTVFAVFIGIWYLFAFVFLAPKRRFLVPPPHKVISVAYLKWSNLHPLLDALALSTRVALTGLAIAIVIGMGLAVLMSQARWVEAATYPYAVALQTLPILALTPLIGFWFGFNFRARVIVCVIIALFPIIANTLFGLKSVDQGHHDLFSLHNASRWTRLRKLNFPAALPAVFTGLRISAGLSVIGAIVGDFFFRQGDAGLGVLISNYQLRLQSEQMFGTMILAMLLGLSVFWIFGFIGNKIVGSWHDSARKAT